MGVRIRLALVAAAVAVAFTAVPQQGSLGQIGGFASVERVGNVLILRNDEEGVPDRLTVSLIEEAGAQKLEFVDAERGIVAGNACTQGTGASARRTVCSLDGISTVRIQTG